MKLVVFDMDGTLVDSQAFIVQTMAEAFVAHGLVPPSLEEGRKVIGLSLELALARLSGWDVADIAPLAQRYRDVFLSKAHLDFETQEALYPGARDAVELLGSRDDIVLGIATGKSLNGVKRVLGLHELAHHFVTRQTPDNNPSKPHPGMLHTAMAETGLEARQTAMIGDTSFDIEMAVAAGVHAIGVSWGYHSVDDLRAAGAHVVVDDYAALLNAIDAF